MATTVAQWHPPPPPAGGAAGAGRLLLCPLIASPRRRRRAATVSPRAFGRDGFDGFVRRAWRGANAGAERLAFEARQAAERLNGRFSMSRRLADAVRAARARAVEIDAELGIGRRCRSFSVDFSRNWPRVPMLFSPLTISIYEATYLRSFHGFYFAANFSVVLQYRRELNDFMATPIGRALSTLFFIWFALSGWLFRVFIFSTFVLPFAAPLLLGTLASRVAIEGTCPACKRRFVGYRNQAIRCMNCQNIVWQPNSRSSGGAGSSRSSGPDVIDVEFEEK